jgi:hypothetical protein
MRNGENENRFSYYFLGFCRKRKVKRKRKKLEKWGWKGIYSCKILKQNNGIGEVTT